MMQIFPTIIDVRSWRKNLTPGETLAFVPTMGNLHDGHLSLVREAKTRADRVIVSIFVNPLQFGAGEDLGAYPRTFDEDCRLLREAGVDAVFCPNEQELYPHGEQQVLVEPPPIQDELCGAYRPGHFRGVTTVVCKLFNIVQPDIACFGRKDYQQLHIIRAMVEQLNLPVEIVGVAIGRAEDGLALSSRNGYLSAEERAEAVNLSRQLQALAKAVHTGRRDYPALGEQARQVLQGRGWQVDYVEVRDADSLTPATADTRHLVALAAARVGKTRLIDNLEITL